MDPDRLRQDLKNYYFPFVDKLLTLRQSRDPNEGIIVGVSAIQGAGKTTQGEVLDILLTSLGHYSMSLSIDDHYITHEELNKLREKDPRYIRRGVTHDIPLAIDELRKLKHMKQDEVILIASYDKGAHQGDGDRFRWIDQVPGLELKIESRDGFIELKEAYFNGIKLELPKNMGASVAEGEQGKVVGWKVVSRKPDFIFYDGWMLGARRVEDESVFDAPLPALETPEEKQFAKDVNRKLELYHSLWEMIDFMNMLYVPNYQMSIKWRDQAEDALRKKGEGMTPEQIVDFVHYFWRSVHPAIQIKNMAEDQVHTQQVVVIGDDHSIQEVRSV